MKITKSKKTVNDDIRLKMKRWVALVKKKVFMFNFMELKKAKKKQKNTFFASI